MKAKTLMGMIACASACAVSYANVNDPWFSGAASGTSLTAETGSWKQNNVVITGSTENGVTVAEGAITLENEDSSKLSLVPGAASPALNDGLVTITSTAVLTPSEYSSLDTEITGAHAGFTVVSETVNNVESFYYCGYASGETTRWIRFTTGPQSASAETTFTIQLDYRTHKVKFLVGNTALTDGSATEFSIGSSYNALSSVDAFGSGTLKSIATEYERAVCVVDETKYGSITDALSRGGTSGSSGSIQYISSSGVPVSATAANGLDAATCIAIGVDPSNEDAVARFVPADSDTDSNRVTLKVRSENVDTGVYVTYTINDGTSSTTQQSNDGTVKIPTTTGVYTITPTSVSTSPAN